ncbi:MAG TPA: EAL domain-containing protein [Terriglobales bacterium]|nr:EAL domain-containing protein [Terriglobales bacterium]
MPNSTTKPAEPARTGLRQAERREWWLWSLAILVTLLLTVGIASFLLPLLHAQVDPFYAFNLRLAARGLVGAVLLFDIYTLYLQYQISRMRRRMSERDELFRLVSENAGDMIALVDMDGKRLYNSPAYEKILGYSAEELSMTSSFDQIHPDDRHRVMEAAEHARRTGVGRTLEYRIRHKDGSWRVLESSASPILDETGKAAKMVIVNRDVTTRKHAEEKLAHQNFHDALTGLPNRSLFLDRVQRAFIHSRRHPEYKFAVLFIDVDDFKKFNDSFGYAAGDQVIVELASRLASSLRQYQAVARLALMAHGDDTLARLGGDEFAVVLDDIKDPSDAIRVANRIQDAVAAPFAFNGQEVFSSASIGIVLSSADRDRAEDLLRDADIAMYRAKAAGKARCEVFDAEMHARAVDRLRLERDLRAAVARGEFLVHYQPIVRLENGRIVGFEALARWQHPERGVLLPGEFIDLAEETGLIVPMNRWLLREICQQARVWHARFAADPPLTVTTNITSKELAQEDLVSSIRRTLQQTAMSPRHVQLEIRETVAMADAENAAGVFSRLKALGVSLSIDDFGTGYSSLSRLQGLPLDTLKIDRSFISDMHDDPDKREIVRIIVMLGQQLGMKVVAEGTETAEQVKYLKGLGCDFAQGYFFSKPVDARAFEELLLAGHIEVPQLSR